MKKRILFLLACTMIFLSSCEKEESMEASGKQVRVRFSLQESPYTGHETLTRSSGEASTVLETVEIPLGDNLYLDAVLLAEPASSTRSGESVLTLGSKVRIIAYNSGSLTFAQSQEYTYTAAGLIGDDLELPPGTYTFVAYSNNSPVEALAYGTDVTETVIISPPNDLVWGTTENPVVIDGTNTQITITLSHQFSRVKYSTTISGATLNSITASLASNYQGKLTKQTGGLVKDAKAAEQSLLSGDEEAYRIVYTGNDNPFYVRIGGSITGPSNTAVTFSNLMAAFKKTLVPGGSYTLQVNFHRGLTWAQSNIYWDPNLYPERDEYKRGGLTFKPHGYVGKENNYQGVFFRWGSLVGIDPCPYNDDVEWNNPGNILYVPTYVSASDNSWAAYSLLDWNDVNIPYVVTSFSDDQRADHLSGESTPYYYEQKTGDICRYLSHIGAVSGSYRMPTANELRYGNSDSSDPTVNYDETNWRTPTTVNGYWTRIGAWIDYFNPLDWINLAESPNITYTDPTGRYTGLKSGGNYSGYTTFPASGYRYNGTGGDLFVVGNSGRYWSSSLVRVRTICSSAVVR
ncbi:MAG: FimB/Mfa2 family fimbrial subunit [Dysgonamonadaceae bacterium]|jgi:hypothetical protein|nr:FimB/Mfa2 family fimbrial subunit [Dysgonamonadaceae bacterium]